MHTYIVNLDTIYPDLDAVTARLRLAGQGKSKWNVARLFPTCYLFYVEMNANEMAYFLKEVFRGSFYIFHETNGNENFLYRLNDNQLRTLRKYVTDKEKIENRILKKQVEELQKQRKEKEEQELDEEFEKSELSELMA